MENYYENNIVLSGRIVHLFECKNNIGIMTLSTNTGRNIKHNYPKVLIDRKNFSKVFDNFQVGDIVTVKGNLQSSVHPEQGRSCVIFATEIIDTGLRLFFNSFTVAGEVRAIRELEQCRTVYIHTEIEINGYTFKSTVPIVS